MNPMNSTLPKPQTPVEPFMVTRRQLNEMFSSPTLVTQMIKAGWITTIRAGKQGREARFSYESAKQAWDRYESGEEPDQAQPETNDQGQS